MSRLRQCDLGRRCKRSTKEAAVSVINAATRLVRAARKFDHITPPSSSASHATDTTADLVQTRRARLPMLAGELRRVADIDSRRRLDRSASTLELNIPPARRVIVGDRAFGVSAARVWNGLPPDIAASPSLSVFKRQLKTSLFSRSFDVWLGLLICVTLSTIFSFVVKCCMSFYGIIIFVHSSSSSSSNSNLDLWPFDTTNNDDDETKRCQSSCATSLLLWQATGVLLSLPTILVVQVGLRYAVFGTGVQLRLVTDGRTDRRTDRYAMRWQLIPRWHSVAGVKTINK